MTRGRKATPTALLKAKGQYRADRHDRADEPQVECEAPGCPPELSAEAKKEWKRLSAELLASGILTKLDRGILALHCQAWGNWIRARKDIRHRGMIIRTVDGGLYQNPWVGIFNKAVDQMAKTGPLLGLDPSSRTKIKVDKPKQVDNPKLKYFPTRAGGAS